MADEKSHPGFGISGMSPIDDAWRLRKQAALSALDEVLKAIDKDLVRLEFRPPSEDERGLPQTIDAVKLAVENVGACGLKAEARRLSNEGNDFFVALTDQIPVILAKGASEDEVCDIKQIYGEFPIPPTEPEEFDSFLIFQRVRCRREADILRRHVERVRGLLIDSCSSHVPLGSMNKAPAHSHPEKTPHTKSEEPGNVLRTIDPLASQPDSRDPKKTRFRPNPKTVGIICQIQHGKSNNEIVAETGASVPNIRMIRSRLEKGKYEI